MTYLRSKFLGLGFLALTGCYTTKLNTGLAPDGPVYTQQQWFTIAGGVNLSEPLQSKCQDKQIAYVQSALKGKDILLNIGLTVAGGTAGYFMCKDSTDPIAIDGCNTISTLAPLLISSRTITYQCAAAK